MILLYSLRNLWRYLAMAIWKQDEISRARHARDPDSSYLSKCLVILGHHLEVFSGPFPIHSDFSEHALDDLALRLELPLQAFQGLSEVLLTCEISEGQNAMEIEPLHSQQAIEQDFARRRCPRKSGPRLVPICTCAQGHTLNRSAARDCPAVPVMLVAAARPRMLASPGCLDEMPPELW